MAITYGFFNSVNGDRKYNADQMSEYFKGLISNGVYESVGGALQVTAGSGMNVTVASGRGVINCKWINNDAPITVPITQAHALLNRWTAVVLALDITNRTMAITTIDGLSSSSPRKPNMINTATMVTICLAYVYVGAGVTSISQANITDMRGSNLCGWVTGLIQQVDTSQLFLQWQTAFENYYNQMTQEFNDWFATLTGQLNVNTYIQKFYKRVVLSGGAGVVIALNMTGYTYESSDIISVYINGLYAAPDVDYYLDTSHTPPELHPNANQGGTEVIIVVLKSKIGFNTIIGSDNAVITGSDGSTLIGG